MSSFERIFWFYQRLKQNGYPSRQRYMDTFEVSESTFKRDLAYFRDRMGAPVDYASEHHGYFLTHTAFELPSFWFNRMQLLLLIGICNQLRKMKGLSADSELSLFRDRLQGLLTMHDGSDITECFSFEHVEWAICYCRYLDLLMEAILQRRCVSGQHFRCNHFQMPAILHFVAHRGNFPNLIFFEVTQVYDGFRRSFGSNHMDVTIRRTPDHG